MQYQLAQDGDRLDTIVYAYYGTLSALGKVLTVNQHIALKIILEDRDIVYLPVIDTAQTSSSGVNLWD